MAATLRPRPGLALRADRSIWPAEVGVDGLSDPKVPHRRENGSHEGTDPLAAFAWIGRPLEENNAKHAVHASGTLDETTPPVDAVDLRHQADEPKLRLGLAVVAPRPDPARIRLLHPGEHSLQPKPEPAVRTLPTDRTGFVQGLSRRRGAIRHSDPRACGDHTRRGLPQDGATVVAGALQHFLLPLWPGRRDPARVVVRPSVWNVAQQLLRPAAGRHPGAGSVHSGCFADRRHRRTVLPGHEESRRPPDAGLVLPVCLDYTASTRSRNGTTHGFG